LSRSNHASRDPLGLELELRQSPSRRIDGQIMAFCEPGCSTRVIPVLVREDEPIEALAVDLALPQTRLDLTAGETGVDDQSA